MVIGAGRVVIGTWREEVVIDTGREIIARGGGHRDGKASYLFWGLSSNAPEREKAAKA